MSRPSYNPMKQYAVLSSIAAKGAVDTSIELRRKTGKLNVKELTKQDIKHELSKLKIQLNEVHELALEEAKRHAKMLFRSARLGMEEESSEESSVQQKKPKKRKRPRTDISKFVSQKVPKRAAAEDDILELADTYVERLNKMYGEGSTSYKKVDSNKSTVIKIIRVKKGNQYTHSLIGKYEMDRRREQKPRNPADGEIVNVETEDHNDHVTHSCYNEDKELVTVFKQETIKKGDILRANAKGGSAVPVPSVRGNIIDNFEDVVSRSSKVGIQKMVIKEDENQESSESSEQPEKPTQSDHEAGEGDQVVEDEVVEDEAAKDQVVEDEVVEDEAAKDEVVEDDDAEEGTEQDE